MKIINAGTALAELVGNSGWGVSIDESGEYQVNWSEDYTGIKPTNDEIDAEIQRQKDEWATQEYARNRAKAYPSIADQLDMIFHAGLGGDEFQAAIQAVKDAYPKPE